MKNSRQINIRSADSDRLKKISSDGMLSLSLAEMQAIQNYFIAIGRDVTQLELETFAQTWSEHCVHKTFNSPISYSEWGGESNLIDGLLKNTIMRATEKIDKNWCVSVFSDNAGIIKFDEENNITFKVETHNHPSAIEPYGGAGTGIGGVIRDTLGTGLGAKPIINTDVFCFGLPTMSYGELPKGTLHPKRIFKGVVAGVRDYGNRMGIPTANGSIHFDRRYSANPLVFCGSVGIIPNDRCDKKVNSGDLVVAIGGRTGRDGIHGATFSSIELDDNSENLASVVQLGNPIVEKKIVELLMQARALKLYTSITDCGAGGFSSAVGEMGEKTGVEVHLENAPLKYDGLEAWEIWVSESQERMVLSVPPENIDRFIELCDSEEVEATVLGKFTDTQKLKVFHNGEIVAELDMEFLFKGLPRSTKIANWQGHEWHEPTLAPLGGVDLTEELLQILASPNVASKEFVVRQYDHEVQGGMVVKPFVGAENDGPSDACVVMPILGSWRGVVVSNGINPKYGDIDPYQMAAAAIDEALRNLVAVGGNLEFAALLDNFSWGSPENPAQLGGLVRAAMACRDIAIAYGTPFISGKDSLYNEFHDRTTGEKMAIPPTLLISAIGVMEDVRKAVTMDLKSPGNLIYILGKTYMELGGSHFYELYELVGNSVPIVRPEEGKLTMTALSKAIDAGLVRSCHDCSEGGIGVAMAEMAFAGGFGANLELANVDKSHLVDRDEELLFSESNSRFIVEISPELQEEFERLMNEVPMGLVGKVVEEPILTIVGTSGKEVVKASISQLKASWQSTFDW